MKQFLRQLSLARRLLRCKHYFVSLQEGKQMASSAYAEFDQLVCTMESLAELLASAARQESAVHEAQNIINNSQTGPEGHQSS